MIERHDRRGGTIHGVGAVLVSPIDLTQIKKMNAAGPEEHEADDGRDV